MHFQRTRLADSLCSNERSSESAVLKLTVLYCHGHIKRKTMHDLWSYAYAWLATIFPLVVMQRDALMHGFVSDSWATCQA